MTTIPTASIESTLRTAFSERDAAALLSLYADGTKVVCSATAELRDGRIVREVGVQAWDA